MHIRVKREKKQSIINGKPMWLRPKFAQIRRRALPSERKIAVTSVAQAVDRAWRFTEERLGVSSAIPVSIKMREKVRPAQSEYWHRGRAPWASVSKALT